MARESWQENHGFGIKCKCGHNDDIDNFTKTPMGLALPEHQYQCPKCSVSWQLRTIEPDTITEYGQCIPGRREIVEVGGML